MSTLRQGVVHCPRHGEHQTRVISHFSVSRSTGGRDRYAVLDRFRTVLLPLSQCNHAYLAHELLYTVMLCGLPPAPHTPRATKATRPGARQGNDDEHARRSTGIPRSHRPAVGGAADLAGSSSDGAASASSAPRTSRNLRREEDERHQVRARLTEWTGRRHHGQMCVCMGTRSLRPRRT